MTSLSETYNRGPRDALWTRRQLLVAVGLFALGTLLYIVGILGVATDLFMSTLGMNINQSWELAGIAGGLGLPAITLGVYTILPASRRQQFGAAAGISLTIVGVVMFAVAFPHQWVNDTPSYVLPVIAVYAAGGLITVGFLFDAVASFRQRNRPGGTVRLSFGRDSDSSSDDDDRQTFTDD